jgi:hypothetical protein
MAPVARRPEAGAFNRGSSVRPTILAVLLVAPTALLFVNHLGEPYMDEVFHVPQVLSD